MSFKKVVLMKVVYYQTYYTTFYVLILHNRSFVRKIVKSGSFNYIQ